MIEAMPVVIDGDELKEKLEETPSPILHFVFAYGSLICRKSRAITAPTLSHNKKNENYAIPVQVSGVERIWAKRTKRGMTAMGVRFRPGAKCTGVLLPVTESELDRFDEREEGYDRYQIPLDRVEEVPFLLENNHYEEKDYEHADIVFDNNNNNNSNGNGNTGSSDTATRPHQDQPQSVSSSPSVTTEHKVFVWIYVQRYDCPADEEFPIAQSYVDIILRGCMGISEEFAESFITTTKGWSPEEVYGEGNSDDNVSDSDNEDQTEEKQTADFACVDKQKENAGPLKQGSSNKDDNTSTSPEEGATWVDDREVPIYVRADPEYSERKADVIDQLLEEHIPEHLDNREPVVPEQ